MDIIQEQQIRYDAVLICGLTNRSGDLSVSEQVSTLQNASGLRNIKGFGHEASNSGMIKSFIEHNPNIPVVLFSAGCDRSDVVLSCRNVNRNRVYLIQPWAPNQDRQSYFGGLNMPKNHIYVGDGGSSGLGINGATRCPKGMRHWDSLPKIGGMVLRMN
jgi:hypothetical protein